MYPARDTLQHVYKGINLGIWETAHLPLPQLNVNIYVPLGAKFWVRGGVGGQFLRNLN